MEKYKKILDMAVRKRKTSYRKLSAEYGWVVQNLSQKLKNNTLTVHEFLAFMDILRIDVELDMSDAITRPEMVDGEPWWIALKGDVKCRELVELSRIIEAHHIKVRFRLRETGVELNSTKDGMGMRLRSVDDGETYDTKHGTLIATSFEQSAENRFDVNGKAEELYIDANGRYFLAVYSSDGKTRLKGISKEAADIFVDMHGLYKG